jgi:twitching motility protein PilI
MANRQALRDLQSRLAERLQSVQGAEATAAWLAVECDRLGMLFPLSAAGEIFAVPTLVPVPHTRPWFVGVANLRGRLHGVADLAAFLGLRPAPRAGDVSREQARVLALNPSLGSHCALLVDRLAGLRNASQLRAEPAPTGDERPAFAPQTWRDDDGRRWIEIDLAALAAHPQFLAIAA